MNYFKTFVTCVFAISAMASVAYAAIPAENVSTVSNSEVQTAESVTIEKRSLEHTDWYRETEWGTYIVSTPYGKLETKVHPTLLTLDAPVAIKKEETETFAKESVQSNSLATSTEFDPITYQVNKSYDIPKEFYYDVLPVDMHCLVEGICELEHTQEISSMFLFAVAATEVGWHGEFAGENNWFNWTPDAENYQGFATTEDCIAYTGKRFQSCYFNPEWYAGFGQEMDDYFTVDEINSRYAFYNDNSVNWYWGEVVTEILGSLNSKYARWVAENYG